MFWQSYPRNDAKNFPCKWIAQVFLLFIIVWEVIWLKCTQWCHAHQQNLRIRLLIFLVIWIGKTKICINAPLSHSLLWLQNIFLCILPSNAKLRTQICEAYVDETADPNRWADYYCRSTQEAWFVPRKLEYTYIIDVHAAFHVQLNKPASAVVLISELHWNATLLKMAENTAFQARYRDYLVFRYLSANQNSDAKMWETVYPPLNELV